VRKRGRLFFCPLDTGQVTEHLFVARVGNVNTFIYTDGGSTVALDAGASEKGLRRALARLAIPPESISHVFLTHSDFDHTGGLGLLPHARVHLGRDEEPMIDGTRARMLRFYRNPRLGRPYTLLKDGDVKAVGPIRVQAIASPGHTPGSMSYLINGKILFTGDTLTLRNGRVREFFRFFTMDMDTMRRSIRKLALLPEISLLCTAHTGCTEEFAEAIRRWRT
jgi:glyoxylase-like metal-dependent hydrolase (beta-lactamase superfamily II)